MERAFTASPVLQRPVPDLAALRPAEPAFRSIVTAPPAIDGKGAASQAVSAV